MTSEVAAALTELVIVAVLVALAVRGIQRHDTQQGRASRKWLLPIASVILLVLAVRVFVAIGQQKREREQSTQALEAAMTGDGYQLTEPADISMAELGLAVTLPAGTDYSMPSVPMIALAGTINHCGSFSLTVLPGPSSDIDKLMDQTVRNLQRGIPECAELSRAAVKIGSYSGAEISLAGSVEGISFSGRLQLLRGSSSVLQFQYMVPHTCDERTVRAYESLHDSLRSSDE
jgi:hypothetical protein